MLKNAIFCSVLNASSMKTPRVNQPENHLIFDIGMHIGEDTAYYLHKGFRVVAVEANPVLVRDACMRFKADIDAGRLIIENVAIADCEGKAPFWICDDLLEWSSFDRAIASRRGYRHHCIEVDCLRLPALLEKHGVPHYMKIDIEGHDRVCVAQLTQNEAPSYISVESYNHQAVSDLESLGYTKFKIIDQICFLPLEHPYTTAYRFYWFLKKSYDRSLFDKSAYLHRLLGKVGGRCIAERIMKKCRMDEAWVFQRGSSGFLSENMPGRWISAKAAISAIQEFDKRFQQTGEAPESRWFDIHAKK